MVSISYQHNINIYSSVELITELTAAIHYPHIAKCFSQGETQKVIQLFKMLAIDVEIEPVFSGLDDPRDNFLVDIAYAAKADCIVSGDRKVLARKHVGPIQIISLTQFKRLLTKTN